MENLRLEEYHCACGKLLFKGIIFASVVEIKCKRCARISSFGDLLKSKSPVSFLISIDNEGIIRDLCRGAEVMLGYPRAELIGNPIARVCPVIRDTIHPEKEEPGRAPKDHPYRIQDNAFMVRDGGTISAESYCIAPEEGGTRSGYYIFSRLGGTEQ